MGVAERAVSRVPDPAQGPSFDDGGPAPDALVDFLRGKLNDYAAGSLCQERLQEIIQEISEETKRG